MSFSVSLRTVFSYPSLYVRLSYGEDTCARGRMLFLLDFCGRRGPSSD